MRAKYLQIFLNKLPLTFSYSPKGVHSPVRVGKNGYLSSIAISSSSTSISSSHQYVVGHQWILETKNGWWDTWTDRQTSERGLPCQSLKPKKTNNVYRWQENLKIIVKYRFIFKFNNNNKKAAVKKANKHRRQRRRLNEIVARLSFNNLERAEHSSLCTGGQWHELLLP